jgi:hypothetical protein
VEDGKYHRLTVKIVGASKLSVSAREGYFAPNRTTDSKQLETNLLSDALYSQTEVHDLPIQLQTQTVHADKPPAKLNVLALVDLDTLPHHQGGGKNLNELRVLAGIFDRNGKYLGSLDRKIAVHWSDDDAGTQTATTFSFLLDPGAYLVRLVVRDTETHSLTAQSAIVEIP